MGNIQVVSVPWQFNCIIMRRILLGISLAAIVAAPAHAQFRDAVSYGQPASRLYATNGKVGALLSQIFNPSVFNMSHSFEMSAGSWGGNGYSLGMYTNTMAWQFSPKLAARMDVAVAYSPQNQIAQRAGFTQQRPQVFLRNAEVSWRPSEKVSLQLQVRQNPYAYRGYGMGGSPYGYHPYGYRGYRGWPGW